MRTVISGYEPGNQLHSAWDGSDRTLKATFPVSVYHRNPFPVISEVTNLCFSVEEAIEDVLSFLFKKIQALEGTRNAPQPQRTMSNNSTNPDASPVLETDKVLRSVTGKKRKGVSLFNLCYFT